MPNLSKFQKTSVAPQVHVEPQQAVVVVLRVGLGRPPSAPGAHPRPAPRPMGARPAGLRPGRPPLLVHLRPPDLAVLLRAGLRTAVRQPGAVRVERAARVGGPHGPPHPTRPQLPQPSPRAPRQAVRGDGRVLDVRARLERPPGVSPRVDRDGLRERAPGSGDIPPAGRLQEEDSRGVGAEAAATC